MALEPHIGTLLCQTMVNAAVDTIDTGTNYFKVFSGALPATCGTADPSGLLVTITLPTPAFGAAAVAGATFSAPKAGTWSAAASAGGDAACFRVYDDTDCIMQGTAGETADTPDLVFDEKTIVNGSTVYINTFTFALPYTPEG
jgi:hypothetical protein